jgi:uncharacterized protein (DUF2062 family)
MFWPRRSWSRSVQYVLLRLKRLPSSPHRIAVGAAAGVFAVFTPFLGGQLMLAAVLSVVMRGSILASFLASFVGNPFSYPIIWFATYNLGNILIGDRATVRLVDLRGQGQALWDSIVGGSLEGAAHALESLWPVVKPMVVGSLPLGGFAAALTYVGVRRLIAGARARKRQRVGIRAAAHT